MRLWVVSYDIVDDRVRLRVAATLAGAGLARIQYSVFEGWLEPRDVAALEAALAELIDRGEDKVRLYPVSPRDEGRRRFASGQPAPAPLPDYWLL